MSHRRSLSAGNEPVRQDLIGQEQRTGLAERDLRSVVPPATGFLGGAAGSRERIIATATAAHGQQEQPQQTVAEAITGLLALTGNASIGLPARQLAPVAPSGAPAMAPIAVAAFPNPTPLASFKVRSLEDISAWAQSNGHPFAYARLLAHRSSVWEHHPGLTSVDAIQDPVAREIERIRLLVNNGSGASDKVVELLILYGPAEARTIKRSVLIKIVQNFVVNLATDFNPTAPGDTNNEDSYRITVSSSGEARFKPAASIKKLTSFQDWLPKWMLYSMLSAQVYTPLVNIYADWAQHINEQARQHPWLVVARYDEEARRMVASSRELTLCSPAIRVTLLASIMTRPPPPVDRARAMPYPGAAAGSRICFRWNRDGDSVCPGCRYQHVCLKCNGPHPERDCKNFNLNNIRQPRMPMRGAGAV